MEGELEDQLEMPTVPESQPEATFDTRNTQAEVKGAPAELSKSGEEGKENGDAEQETVRGQGVETTFENNTDPAGNLPAPSEPKDEMEEGVEGLLLLQHSVGSDDNKTGSKSQAQDASSKDVAANTTAASGAESSPKRRTVSLSKLYQNMEEKPELRDPVVRARVKLEETRAASQLKAKEGQQQEAGEDNGNEQGPADEDVQKAPSEENAKSESGTTGQPPKPSQTPQDPIHEAVQGKIGKGPGMTMPVGAGRGKNFYRGVYIHKNVAMPYSVMKFHGKQCFLGYFRTALEASRAWDLAALKRAMECRRPLSTTKLNYPLEEYMDNQRLITTLVQSSFDEVMLRLRSASDTSRNQELKVEELLEGREIPETDDQEGNVEVMPAEDKIEDLEKEQENVDIKSDVQALQDGTTLVRRPVKQLRTMHAGSRLAQNNWIKRLRDDHKFKGVYFSRDGVPYSKVELEGKYHYLGRFDTMEEAARAYDLATLKRAMIHNQTSVSLNFPAEDYIQDDELMEFMRTADCDEVAAFIRNLAQNRRGTKIEEEAPRTAPRKLRRQKAELPPMPAQPAELENHPSLSDWIAKERLGGVVNQAPREDVDWNTMGLTPPVEEVPGAGSAGRVPRPWQGRGGRVTSQLKGIGKRVCEPKVAARVANTGGWVQVGVNMYAIRITEECPPTSERVKQIPGSLAAWFHPQSDPQANQVIELIDPSSQRSHHLTSSKRDGITRFSGWNKFVEEIGLAIGDILVICRTECHWKLRYGVFSSPKDAQMGHGAPQQDTQEMPSTHSPSFPSPNLIPVMAPTQAEAIKGVQSALRGNGGLQLLQKLPRGQFLVQIPSANEPGKSNMLVIPDGSQRAARAVTSSGPVQSFPPSAVSHPPGTSSLNTPQALVAASQGKKLVYQGGRAPGMLTAGSISVQSAVSGSTPTSLGRTSGGPLSQTPSQPAQHRMLPTNAGMGGRVPVQQTMQVGAPSGGNKMYVMSDANGQLRIVNERGQVVKASGTILIDSNGTPILSQMQGGGQVSVVKGGPPRSAVAPGVGGYQNVGNNKRIRVGHQQVPVSGLDQTVNNSGLQVSAPSTTVSPPRDPQHAKHAGVDKGDQVMVGQDTGPALATPILIDEADRKQEGGQEGKQMVDWYSQVLRIVNACNNLTDEVKTKFKLAFINKMNEGQQRANFMELRTLNEAGNHKQIAVWVKTTVENMQLN